MGRTLAVGTGLFLAVLILYAPVRAYDFVNYDDPQYVYENAAVLEGLTWEGVRWSFGLEHWAWHPLVFVSHMADVELFGIDAPGAHHVTNVVLHAANALLLLLLLVRSTGRFGPSLFVAAVFALHPLRVESVAWVTERKDVLSTLFALLSLLAYERYARRPRLAGFLQVFLWLSLSLLSKSMYVTLPFLMLLLDFWPLARLDPARPTRGLRRLVLEKVALLPPVFFVAAMQMTAALASEGARLSGGQTVSERVANALLSYVRYAELTFWPRGLAVHYPFPSSWPGSWIDSPWLATGLLSVASAVALWQMRARPYVAVGWLWYVGLLVPVIGFIQAGPQAMADRYTYLPAVGLTLIPAWWVAEWAEGHRGRSRAALAVGVAACLVLAAGSRAQLRHWSDSLALWERELAVVGDNLHANYHYAIALGAARRFEESTEQYRLALSEDPDHVMARTGLGITLLRTGPVEEAERELRRARELGGASGELLAGLAIAATRQDRPAQAAEYYREALREEPGLVAAANNLAWLLATTPRPGLRAPEEAVSLAKRAARETGDRDPAVLETLAAAYAATGHFERAIETAERAERLATAAGRDRIVREIRSHLELYRAGQPYVDR